MLSFQVKVDLGVMTMKGYSTFQKATALLEPHHYIVLCHIRTLVWWWWGLTFCRDAVLYSPSQLGSSPRWKTRLFRKFAMTLIQLRSSRLRFLLESLIFSGNSLLSTGVKSEVSEKCQSFSACALVSTFLKSIL